jgi:hypothetical protein
MTVVVLSLAFLLAALQPTEAEDNYVDDVNAECDFFCNDDSDHDYYSEVYGYIDIDDADLD